MADRLGPCVLCPRLCRTACPVATGSSREAAVPAMIAGVLHEWREGRLPASMAAEAATLCTDCGACQDLCHIHQPLPALIVAARTELLPPPSIEPLRPSTGVGDLVAVEADDRPWAAALAASLGKRVARWVTADGLGVEAVGWPMWEARAAALVARAAGKTIVVADGGSARALREAGVSVVWLHTLVPEAREGCGSCETDGPTPIACCGGAGPLAAHHPEDAGRVAAWWLERAGTAEVRDARCRAHIARSGAAPRDTVDRLLLGDNSA